MKETNIGTCEPKTSAIDQNATTTQGEQSTSRREALKRFASYTAPAMIALMTANEALAS